MAHELEMFTNGTASFVSAREHAWHKLGITLPGEFDATEAMTYARLGGWNVRKEALQAVSLTADGVSTIPVPGKFATIRTHPETGQPDVLGVVGDQYTVIQNEQHTELLNTLVDESGAHFETAGSLKGGRQVFVTMKLPKTISVAGVDDIDIYIAALNSHDGSTAFRLLVTPVRIVCANTQAAAIRGAKSSFSITHTSGAKGHIATARRALGLTFAYADAFQAEAEKMIQQTMTETEFGGIVRQLYPVAPNPSARTSSNAYARQATMRKLFSYADTNAAIRGTRWAAYQAVTEYIDHFAPVPKTAPDGAAVRAERVVTSGELADTKARAFALLSV